MNVLVKIYLFSQIMDNKKISFGFSKIVKKPQLIPATNSTQKHVKANKIELIECVEEQTIKIAGYNYTSLSPSTIQYLYRFTSRKTDEVKETLLTIPLQSNNTPLEKVSRLKLGEETTRDENKANEGDLPKVVETLEQQAARELMEDLKQSSEDTESKTLTVKLNADELPLDGAKESSLDDYDRIPIQQFGLALLRGMGWKDEEQKAKKENKFGDDFLVCRPKGLGLGAEKVVRSQAKPQTNSKGEELVTKKGAYVRVLAGKFVDKYGQIEGLDEESGRMFVKFALGGNRESINERLIQPVSEKEYQENKKVISEYEL